MDCLCYQYTWLCFTKLRGEYRWFCSFDRRYGNVLNRIGNVYDSSIFRSWIRIEHLISILSHHARDLLNVVTILTKVTNFPEIFQQFETIIHKTTYRFFEELLSMISSNRKQRRFLVERSPSHDRLPLVHIPTEFSTGTRSLVLLDKRGDKRPKRHSQPSKQTNVKLLV